MVSVVETADDCFGDGYIIDNDDIQGVINICISSLSPCVLMLMTDVDIDDNDYAYVQGGLWVYIA